MMSISPSMTAGHAGGYFSREDYYLGGDSLGENSLWVGKGSQDLGLHGPVREEEFRALCRGEDPAGNRLVSFRLSRNPDTGALVERHRAGNDLTFSAPKSVSIAYVAGVSGIKEAHDAAVLSVLSHVEEHYCHYRTPGGIRNGGMVAAKFDHATSRNIDPQLHSHVFALNVVHAQDGSWKANEPKAIFQDQRSLGLLYRQALACELASKGFGLEVQDRAEMYFELKSVDPQLVGHFSSRRVEIERQVEEWQAQGLYQGVSHARLYEMACQGTKDPKRDLSREEVSGIFARGFEACGTSPELVRLELEEGRSLAPAFEGEAPSRVIERAVRELTEREAVLDRARVLDEAVRISGGAHTIPELNQALDGGTPEVLPLGRDAKGREYYTTLEMRDLERRNLERISELEPRAAFVAAPEVERFLGRLAAEGVEPTRGQKREIVNELTGSRGVALTMGDPGTGKTSTLGLIERFNEEELRPEGRTHLSINLSYTGKAARELSLATGRPACTIHSFEKENPASKFALQRQNGEPPMVVIRSEKILMPVGPQQQVVIRVDEAGFLGARQTERLLAVVRELGKSGVQVKLHLLGDAKQMPGIQAGNLLGPLQRLGARGEIDSARLTDILRQRDPGLLEIARGLNRMDRPLAENAQRALRTLQGRREVVEIADQAQLRNAVVRHYLEESKKPSRHPRRMESGEPQRVLLLTSTNAARRELNSEIRRERISTGEIAEGNPYAVLVPVRQGVTVEGYRVGDTVLFCGETRPDGHVERWGTRLNTEAKVTGINRERNLVQVTYSFDTKKHDGRELSRTVTKEFSAADMAGKTALYREEERHLSAGDRIVLLKNDSRLDVQNGTLGTIREIDPAGGALLDLDGREVRIDLKRYRHLDHAYALTIYKSQGATVEHSILYAPCRSEEAKTRPAEERQAAPEEQYGRTTYNALNVAVTRAQYGTRIFTNSMEGLARSVETVEEKSTTLQGRFAGNERRLGEKIGKQEPAVQVPAARPGTPLPVPSPAKEIAAVQKVAGRELELTLPRGFGSKLER
ncbi:relaxase domain-containing protein [Geomonas paludis]|uniref:Conjugative relaxase n=1 Tax=Geomonas paludis TaxID=2740185 RepID=A0A6V8MS38_9BACT|nr:MobF family relaxase [Geomonas paludis]UPU35738.1 relaxase domain-containing protein [Geomonas paludis]GFO62684.1 conjugative relaxase [Geomonas paludis]